MEIKPWNLKPGMLVKWTSNHECIIFLLKLARTRTMGIPGVATAFIWNALLLERGSPEPPRHRTLTFLANERIQLVCGVSGKITRK